MSERSHEFVEKMHVQDLGKIEHIDMKDLFESFDPIRGASDDVNAHNFYHYRGSLTNPPCSDIVNWLLLDDCIPISKEHLD